jgi:peptidoglycan hydrolase-like protein with peptidoglycan-binding domain
MRAKTHFILVFTSCLCLSLYPTRASYTIAKPNNIKPSSVSSPSNESLVVINPGAVGSEVQVIQIQLKALGYYNTFIDGQYGSSTQKALVEFQKAQGLKTTNGIADEKTRKRLETVLSQQTKCVNSPVSTPIVQPKSPANKINLIIWSLFGLSGLTNIALLYVIKKLRQVQPIPQAVTSEQQFLNPSEKNANSEPKLLNPSVDNHPTLSLHHLQTGGLKFSSELLPPEKTSLLLPKVNIVDELIKELRSPDTTKRQKAIWDLTQQGDSRAIQPLVDLMIDADSQQHGLILSALAEIGTRTLKPMNRALAISMQDENPQVRQNAIRDLMRIYDMMIQMSQIVCHGLNDPDPEVQAAARYALNHINRLSVVPEVPDQQRFMEN